MTKTALLLTVLFAAQANAGQIKIGERVDLNCVYRGGNTKENSIELTVKEQGPIARKDIPSDVPDTFLDDMTEEKFALREFSVDAKIKLSEGKTVYHDTELHTIFYGGLSYPDIGDGIKETRSFGSYAEDAYFRAFNIEQDKVNGPLEFGLYWSKNFATTAPLDCTGTIISAEAARPGVVKEPRYDKHFSCKLAGSKEFEAIDFELKVNNLQNERLMEAGEFKNSGRKSGWFVHGEGMDKHVLGKLNDGDAQLLNKVKKAGKTMLVSKYFDECGSWDCFETELSLSFPERGDKKSEGFFYYRENVKGKQKPVLKAKGKVTCDLK